MTILPPCPHADLGQATGQLVGAVALLEQASETLGEVGWDVESEQLGKAMRMIDGVLVELALQVRCDQNRT